MDGRTSFPLGPLPGTNPILTELVNTFRQARVADLLDDFRTLQYYITAAPASPPFPEDHQTEGWTALRQCAEDGHHILNCAADTSVPCPGGGPAEQEKAELQQ